MYLPKFSFERPESIDDVIHYLNENSTKSIILAGGTDLLPRMKYGLVNADRLISLKGLATSAPRLLPDGHLFLDPKMTLAAVTASQVIAEKAPLLTIAAGNVATREIRNTATLGGNLCQDTRCLYFNQSHTFQFVEPCLKRGGDICYFIPKGAKCWAVSMSDTAPALICLDAKLEIMDGGSGTLMDMEKFYSGDSIRPHSIKPHEIVSGVLVPISQRSTGCAFSKLTIRDGIEFGAVTVAALLETEDDCETCRRARIAVGSVSSGPMRARKAEALLEGRSLFKPLPPGVVAQVVEEVKVIPHHGYTKWYLTEALKVETEKVLNQAVERLNCRNQEKGEHHNG